MNHDAERQQLIRQLGAGLACGAAMFGIAVSSGASPVGAFWFALVAAGVLLFLFWGVPSLIDVLAYWRTYTAGRQQADDAEEPRPAAHPAPTAVLREIPVHGIGGERVLTMIDFIDPHERMWREALAKLLWAAQMEGSLTLVRLERYVTHRQHVVDLTDVLRDAGIVTKAPGTECRLAPGITYHAAIRRVTHLTSPLPLPKGLPPYVRTAGTGDRSELVRTGSEQFA